jgi:tetratricopeptide (TPR) repeat protein
MWRAPRIPAAVLAALLVVPPALAGKASDVRTESFRLVNEGVAAVNRGEYDAAVGPLRRASSMALNSFRAHFYLGVALVGARRYAEAVEPLRIALDLDPKHLQAHVVLGDAYLRQGDVREAMASYTRSLQLRAEFPQGLDGLGRAYEALAQDDRAQEHYERAILSNRAYADAYTHLGDLLLRKGRYDEAIQLLREAITVRPDYGPGFTRLALAYSQIGLDNEAVATVNRAIEIEPAVPEHRAALGSILLRMDRLDVSEVAFLAALDRDSGLPEARRGLAEISRRRGDYAKAKEQLEAILADPRIDARTRRESEELRDALERERERFAALERDAASAGDGARRELASLYAGRGEWEAAAAQLVGIAEPTGSDREHLAFARLRQGRFREAATMYAELPRPDGRGDLDLNRGVALARLGDAEGAAEAFAAALGAEPGLTSARAYRANALLRLGRVAEAIDEYKAFLEADPSGEEGQRVRRVLERIAPGTAAPPPVPAVLTGPVRPAPPPAGTETER